MRHNVAGRRLANSGHQKTMFRNLVTELLDHGKIVTTEAKAKEIRGLAEKVITLGKKGGLSSYRQAVTLVLSEAVAKKVFSELAPRYAERPGGYTRIVKLGPRVGDGAPVVQLELV